MDPHTRLRAAIIRQAIKDGHPASLDARIEETKRDWERYKRRDGKTKRINMKRRENTLRALVDDYNSARKLVLELGGEIARRSQALWDGPYEEMIAELERGEKWDEIKQVFDHDDWDDETPLAGK